MAATKVNIQGIHELDFNFPGTTTASITSPGVTTITNLGASGGPVLETNGTLNGSQTLLNLKNGANITITDDGSGDITIAGAASGVTAVTGTAPISSSGGTTPNISVATASTSNFGVVKPDGVSIIATAGVLSVAGSTSAAILTRALYNSTQRALGTVYQNTSSFPLIVSYVDSAVSTAVVAVTDSSTTPTAQVWSLLTNSGNSCSAIFVVMPGNYYKVTGGTWGAWNEYTFNTGTMTASGDLVGSKSLATNYQNSGTGFKIVEVVIGSTGSGASISVFSDATATPTTQVAQITTGTGTNSVFFLVPPSYYYRVTSTSGAISHWNEYNSSMGAVVSGNLVAAPASRRITSNGSVPPISANQNTTGKVKFISAAYTNGNLGTTFCYSDQSCIPFQPVWNAAVAAGATKGVFGIHMPGDFFAIWQDSGTSAGTLWYEYTLG